MGYYVILDRDDVEIGLEELAKLSPSETVMVSVYSGTDCNWIFRVTYDNHQNIFAVQNRKGEESKICTGPDMPWQNNGEPIRREIQVANLSSVFSAFLATDKAYLLCCAAKYGKRRMIEFAALDHKGEALDRYDVLSYYVDKGKGLAELCKSFIPSCQTISVADESEAQKTIKWYSEYYQRDQLSINHVEVEGKTVATVVGTDDTYDEREDAYTGSLPVRIFLEY